MAQTNKKDNFRVRYSEKEGKFIATWLRGNVPQECHRCESMCDALAYVGDWITSLQLAQEDWTISY